MTWRKRTIDGCSGFSLPMRTRLIWLVLACLSLTGCAGLTLDVVRDGSLVAGGQPPGVEVNRQGTLLRVAPSMALQAGDELRTDGRSTAVVSFFSGARAYIQPNSHVRLGSILVYIGEVLIKVKGYFQVDTKYATAASEGTEYLVRVVPGERVQVSVAEDRVGLTSKTMRWPKNSLAVGQTAWLSGPDLIQIGFTAPGETDAIRNRIRGLDQIVPSHTGIGTALLIGTAITAGAVAIGSQSHRDRDRDREPERRRRTADLPAADGASPQDTLPPSRLR